MKNNIMHYINGLMVAGMVFSTILTAQVPPDHDGLLSGDGLGLATYAEANGYPGPRRVLDLSHDLRLTPEQIKAIQDVYDKTKTRAKELGERIVAVEQELNESFASGLVSDNTVRENVDQIEKLRAKLRTLHLIAHLKTKSLLSADQIEIYQRLRRAASKTGH